MVSNASDDFPDPLGPVITVNLPSGRSTSMPLRLFWRAPRISMQPASGSAMKRSFEAIFKPTGNNPRWRRASQILAVRRIVQSRFAGKRMNALVVCLNTVEYLIASTVFLIRQRVVDLDLLRLPLSNLRLALIISVL